MPSDVFNAHGATRASEFGGMSYDTLGLAGEMHGAGASAPAGAAR